MFRLFLFTVGVVLVCLATPIFLNEAFAQNTAPVGKSSPAIKSEVLLANLANPWGVAVQPFAAGDVFVSETSAGQIIRVKVSDNNTVSPVVTGFSTETSAAQPAIKIGPLGLVFLDKITLVVGDGGQKNGAELVRIYQIPEDGKPLTADSIKQKLGPIEAGTDSATGEGDFFGVAATAIAPATALYATSAGDDAKGWILKADLSGTTAGQLKPFIKTKSETGVDRPFAVTTSKRGEVVVGQAGEPDAAKDSVLTFYNGRSGKLLLNLPVGLHDIAGLAYHPKSNLLYAIDISWHDAREGGLYRLDSAIADGKQSVKATKLLSLDRPTAMTFAADGTLYITTLGKVDVGDTKTEKTGQLLKLTGEL